MSPKAQSRRYYRIRAIREKRKTIRAKRRYDYWYKLRYTYSRISYNWYRTGEIFGVKNYTEIHIDQFLIPVLKSYRAYMKGFSECV